MIIGKIYYFRRANLIYTNYHDEIHEMEDIHMCSIQFGAYLISYWTHVMIK